MLAFNAMERIYKSALPTQVLLTLMQKVAMYEYQRPCLDFSQFIMFLLSIVLFRGSQPIRKLLSHHVLKSRPSLILPHESALHGRSPMTSLGETQAPIFRRRILKCYPESHRTGWICIQESTVLMRRHSSPDLRLFADDHALQHPRISEADGFRNLAVQACKRRFSKLGRQLVEVVSYLVYGAVFGFRQCAGGGGESVFFEEETDLVA